MLTSVRGASVWNQPGGLARGERGATALGVQDAWPCERVGPTEGRGAVQAMAWPIGAHLPPRVTSQEAAFVSFC